MENGSDTGKKLILLVTTAASFVTPFMASSINIALPLIGAEFSMSAVLLSWIAFSFLLAAAMVLVPVGRIADLYGRKRVFFIGLLIYTVSCLLCAVASSAHSLIAFRFLQGAGGAMIFGTSVAILTSVFPASERGRVLGINVASVYLGLSAGPFIGGFLTEHFGWRSIFIGNVPIGLVIMALVLWKMKGEWVGARKGEGFDYKGAVLYMATLASFMYGLSSLPGMTGVWLVLLGIVLFAAFVSREIKMASPLLDISLFRRNVTFAFSNLAALINYSATYAVTFLLSLYLQYIKGFSPLHAGIILSAQPVVQALFSPSAGRLSDRIEPRIVASIGMGLTALGLGCFIFLSNDSSLFSIVATLFTLGLGFGLFSSPNTNAIMSSVENPLYGIASGTLATMRLTGQMLSMAIVMLIFAVHIGHAPITREGYPLFLRSVHSAFIVMTLLCTGGIFASLARGRIR
jgi:EmrB/QacA subfamily drug resistance transporter